MDRMSFRGVGCFHDHLGERRVSVHVAGDLVRGQFHHVGQGQFGQQFGHHGIVLCLAITIEILISP